ncbi:PEP-CTERM sorting domain-containing protein [Aquincola tertiaricarbonis]|uniref:PEP-CTERM sorting domain-containing protein n=1 Tax=Aquincola tertiaricarbonis TaxID=391953 RepID=UPI0018DE461D|nr:PEP-CTERM sorting domain-containing protein [Aquincola tertiaricarbonis]
MTALPVQALTHIFEGDVLVGADSVDVQGTLLDVRFYDGSCVAVFNGCDDQGDFLFGSAASPTPRDAAWSLVREVLGRISDVQTPYIGAVLGCRDVFDCDFVAPNSVDPRRQVVNGIAAESHHSTIGFTVTALSSTVDTSTLDDVVYARWSLSPVPEPAPAWLMLVGLLALGHRRLNAKFKWFGVGLRGRRGAEGIPV